MYDPITMGEVALDSRCEHCSGEGITQDPEGPEEHPCIECEGLGMLPTPEGQAILALVRRHAG